MSFRFPSHRIQEIVGAQKCVRLGQKTVFEKHGEHGQKLAVDLDLVDGPLLNLKLFVACGNVANPETYTGALTLEGERIRGLDYSPIVRKRFYKTHVSRGWHENYIDPNLPTADPHRNRHLALGNFRPTDLQHFLHLIANQWHIDLEFERELL